jgi:hypothetical protein
MTTVPSDKMETFKKVSAQMDVLGKKASAGEKVNMCQSCATMGSFFPRGAKMDYVMIKNGSAMLLTSTDQTVVADMQKWAKRNMEETAKMMSAQPEK